MTSLLLPHAPDTAAEVRRAVERELRERQVPEAVIDDALLVVSELVGNALRHGAPLDGDAVRVSWWVAGGAVHVEVCDGGPGLPGDDGRQHRGARSDGATDPPVAAEGGRGLSIVDLLSTRWGTTARSPNGAVGVYAEVPMTGTTANLSRGGHDVPASAREGRVGAVGA